MNSIKPVFLSALSQTLLQYRTKYLSLSAALAAKAGLPEYEAIKAITINPAKILKLDDRIGSIKIGKDADFVICTKNILDIQNKIKTVYVNGKKEA